MPKSKYRFNNETLSYEEVKVSFGKRILKFILFISPSLLVGIVLAFFLAKQIDPPKTKSLEQELTLATSEVKRLSKDINDANKVLDILIQKDTQLYRQAFYAEEFPEEYRIMGTGGSDKYAYLQGFSTSELLWNASKKMDALEQRLVGQSMSTNELLKLAKNKEKLLACIPAIQPVSNKNLKRLASGFGWRIDPHYKIRKRHTGMDFTADRGTKVYATGDGVVESVERKRWGYGKHIVINHGFGYKTLYAHLSAFEVKKGQKIKRGDLIGLVGSTGKSTGSHLHYEVIVNGNKVNPINYYHSDLSPEEYETLLEMSSKSHIAQD